MSVPPNGPSASKSRSATNNVDRRRRRRYRVTASNGLNLRTLKCIERRTRKRRRDELLNARIGRCLGFFILTGSEGRTQMWPLRKVSKMRLLEEASVTAVDAGLRKARSAHLAGIPKPPSVLSYIHHISHIEYRNGSEMVIGLAPVRSQPLAKATEPRAVVICQSTDVMPRFVERPSPFIVERRDRSRL
jgi:hypothetical protein